MCLQVANADFFLKTLPLFDAGDDVGMVLSPQSFYNVDTNQDIFNHGNIQFWEYAQHGYDAIGFISCTGERTAAANPLVAWRQTFCGPCAWKVVQSVHATLQSCQVFQGSDACPRRMQVPIS